MKYDAVIIGGGAAGLFCAIHAGKRGKRVLVLEHNAELGRKVIISGGGRCNFTNIHAGPDNFISTNPHFCKSALSRYTAADFVDLVRKHKIAYYEKKLGQLFCRDSSRQIVEMLTRECYEAKVAIYTGESVVGVTKDDLFKIQTSRRSISAESLVIACGGLSFRKVGASDLGYRIARQFGLKVTETRPSLVAMVMDGKPNINLAGVSVESNVVYGRHSFLDRVLFTHRGLSGPAILQISNYWRKGSPIAIDLLPQMNGHLLFERSKGSRRSLHTLLSDLLPHGLVGGFLDGSMLRKPADSFTAGAWEEIAAGFKDWSVHFRETEGYDRAEVTLGGISTSELSSQSMQSKKVPGLYFVGEVVDVTGWLGGYNFQWAWSSGYAAGTAV